MARHKIISYYATLLLGALFVFSALTKGLDFFAASAKIQEYANFFGVSFPIYIYGIGSLILIGTELLIGFFLINGLFKRYVYFCALIIIIFFTSLTFITAVSGRFDDCGCFGSILATTPWMSFAKNLFLLLLAIFAFPQSQDHTPFNFSDFITSIILTSLLCIISLFSQPLIDSSKYTVGQKLYINADIRSSIDVDFLTTPVSEIATFGIVHRMTPNSVLEILQVLPKTNGKALIITSMLPKDIDPDI